MLHRKHRNSISPGTVGYVPPKVFHPEPPDAGVEQLLREPFERLDQRIVSRKNMVGGVSKQLFFHDVELVESSVWIYVFWRRQKVPGPVTRVTVGAVVVKPTCVPKEKLFWKSWIYTAKELFFWGINTQLNFRGNQLFKSLHMTFVLVAQHKSHHFGQIWLAKQKHHNRYEEHAESIKSVKLMLDDRGSKKGHRYKVPTECFPANKDQQS